MKGSPQGLARLLYGGWRRALLPWISGKERKHGRESGGVRNSEEIRRNCGEIGLRGELLK